MTVLEAAHNYRLKFLVFLFSSFSFAFTYFLIGSRRLSHKRGKDGFVINEKPHRLLKLSEFLFSHSFVLYFKFVK